MITTRTTFRRAAIVVTACTFLAGGVIGAGAAGAAGPKSPCRPGAVSDAPGKVHVRVWHHLIPADAETFAGLVADFNATHPDINVELVDKNPAGRLNGDFFASNAARRPEVVMLDGEATMPAIDGGFVVPVQQCIDASRSTLDDFLPAPLRSAAVGDVQWGVPFGTTANVLVYDRAAFRRAGLDPDRPPTTLADVSAAGRAIIAGGAARSAFGLVDPAPLFLAAGTSLDAPLDAPVALQVNRWIADAHADGLVTPITPDRDSGPVGGLGQHDFAMTLSNTLALSKIATAIQQGQAPGLELGVAAVPTPVGATVPYESDAMFITAGTPVAERAAAWTFLSWLSDPAQQARVGAGTDFFPARRGAADNRVLADRWRRQPELARVWSVLTSSMPVPQDVTPPLIEVRDEFGGAVSDVFFHGVSPDDAFAEAAQRAAADRAGYSADPKRYAECEFAPAPCTRDDELYRVTVDGPSDELVAARGGTEAGPSVSPDGSLVAFASGLAYDADGDIHVMGLDGRGRRQVTTTAGFDTHPDWSPDGKTIVFQHGRTFEPDIWTMDAFGQHRRRLTHGGAQQPAWSPDGEHIAFTAFPSGNPDIWVMDADGSNAHAVATDPADDLWPTWSPDGTRIAFVSTRAGRPTLYLTDLDGSSTREVLPGTAQIQPSWSPDGTNIAVIDLPSHEVYLAAPDGSSYRRLTTSRRQNWQPTWTPDGSSVIVSGEQWPT